MVIDMRVEFETREMQFLPRSVGELVASNTGGDPYAPRPGLERDRYALLPDAIDRAEAASISSADFAGRSR
jgi:hypothetical protein